MVWKMKPAGKRMVPIKIYMNDSELQESRTMDFGFYTMFDPKKYIAFLIAASFWWDNTGRFLGFFQNPIFLGFFHPTKRAFDFYRVRNHFCGCRLFGGVCHGDCLLSYPWGWDSLRKDISNMNLILILFNICFDIWNSGKLLIFWVGLGIGFFKINIMCVFFPDELYQFILR